MKKKEGLAGLVEQGARSDWKMHGGRRCTRVISVTSGKGGVGKTTTTINTALALARMGNRVLILDADFSLANVSVMLGLNPLHTLQHVFEQNIPVSEVVLEGPGGVSIIPAGRGVDWLVTLRAEQRARLVAEVEELAEGYDYLFIDTAAGIGHEVQQFTGASSEVICVINNEPTSLTDAYALMKLVSQRFGHKEFSILVNNVPSELIAKKTFLRIAEALEQFLHVNATYAGFVPRDPAVNEAVCQQKVLGELNPGTSAARAYSSLARELDANFYRPRAHGGVQFFFEQLVEVDAYGR